MKANHINAAALLLTAASVTAAPHPLPMSGTFTDEVTNMTFGYEYVDPSSPYQKRTEVNERPRYCDSLVENRDTSPHYFFWNFDNSAGIHDFCLTASDDQFCSADHYWEQNEVNDIVGAMREQATKDGVTEASTVGKWTANFGFPTSAIRERDPYVAAFAIAIAGWQNQGDGYKKEFYAWAFKASTPRPDKGDDLVENEFTFVRRSGC